MEVGRFVRSGGRRTSGNAACSGNPPGSEKLLTHDSLDIETQEGSPTGDTAIHGMRVFSSRFGKDRGTTKELQQ